MFRNFLSAIASKLTGALGQTTETKTTNTSSETEHISDDLPEEINSEVISEEISNPDKEGIGIILHDTSGTCVDLVEDVAGSGVENQDAGSFIVIKEADNAKIPEYLNSSSVWEHIQPVNESSHGARTNSTGSEKTDSSASIEVIHAEEIEKNNASKDRIPPADRSTHSAGNESLASIEVIQVEEVSRDNLAKNSISESIVILENLEVTNSGPKCGMDENITAAMMESVCRDIDENKEEDLEFKDALEEIEEEMGTDLEKLNFKGNTHLDREEKKKVTEIDPNLEKVNVGDPVKTSEEKQEFTDTVTGSDRVHQGNAQNLQAGVTDLEVKQELTDLVLDSERVHQEKILDSQEKVKLSNSDITKRNEENITDLQEKKSLTDEVQDSQNRKGENVYNLQEKEKQNDHEGKEKASVSDSGVAKSHSATKCAQKENFLEVVALKTAAGHVIPPKDLIYNLGFLTKVDHKLIEKAVLDQYQVAAKLKNALWVKWCRHHSELIFSSSWIDDYMVASSFLWVEQGAQLPCMQEETTDFLQVNCQTFSHNLRNLPFLEGTCKKEQRQEKRKMNNARRAKRWEAEASGPCRDIRLKSDPTISVLQENAAETEDEKKPDSASRETKSQMAKEDFAGSTSTSNERNVENDENCRSLEIGSCESKDDSKINDTILNVSNDHHLCGEDKSKDIDEKIEKKMDIDAEVENVSLDRKCNKNKSQKNTDIKMESEVPTVISKDCQKSNSSGTDGTEENMKDDIGVNDQQNVTCTESVSKESKKDFDKDEEQDEVLCHAVEKRKTDSLQQSTSVCKLEKSPTPVYVNNSAKEVCDEEVSTMITKKMDSMLLTELKDRLTSPCDKLDNSESKRKERIDDIVIQEAKKKRLDLDEKELNKSNEREKGGGVLVKENDKLDDINVKNGVSHNDEGVATCHIGDLELSLHVERYTNEIIKTSIEILTAEEKKEREKLDNLGVEQFCMSNEQVTEKDIKQNESQSSESKKIMRLIKNTEDNAVKCTEKPDVLPNFELLCINKNNASSVDTEILKDEQRFYVEVCQGPKSNIPCLKEILDDDTKSCADNFSPSIKKVVLEEFTHEDVISKLTLPTPTEEELIKSSNDNANRTSIQPGEFCEHGKDSCPEIKKEIQHDSPFLTSSDKVFEKGEKELGTSNDQGKSHVDMTNIVKDSEGDSNNNVEDFSGSVEAPSQQLVNGPDAFVEKSMLVSPECVLSPHIDVPPNTPASGIPQIPGSVKFKDFSVLKDKASLEQEVAELLSDLTLKFNRPNSNLEPWKMEDENEGSEGHEMKDKCTSYKTKVTKSKDKRESLLSNDSAIISTDTTAPELEKCDFQSLELLQETSPSKEGRCSPEEYLSMLQQVLPNVTSLTELIPEQHILPEMFTITGDCEIPSVTSLPEMKIEQDILSGTSIGTDLSQVPDVSSSTEIKLEQDILSETSTKVEDHGTPNLALPTPQKQEQDILSGPLARADSYQNRVVTSSTEHKPNLDILPEFLTNEFQQIPDVISLTELKQGQGTRDAPHMTVDKFKREMKSEHDILPEVSESEVQQTCNISPFTKLKSKQDILPEISPKTEIKPPDITSLTKLKAEVYKTEVQSDSLTEWKQEAEVKHPDTVLSLLNVDENSSKCVIDVQDAVDICDLSVAENVVVVNMSKEDKDLSVSSDLGQVMTLSGSDLGYEDVSSTEDDFGDEHETVVDPDLVGDPHNYCSSETEKGAKPKKIISVGEKKISSGKDESRSEDVVNSAAGKMTSKIQNESKPQNLRSSKMSRSSVKSISEDKTKHTVKPPWNSNTKPNNSAASRIPKTSKPRLGSQSNKPNKENDMTGTPSRGAATPNRLTKSSAISEQKSTEGKLCKKIEKCPSETFTPKLSKPISGANTDLKNKPSNVTEAKVHVCSKDKRNEKTDSLTGSDESQELALSRKKPEKVLQILSEIEKGRCQMDQIETSGEMGKCTADISPQAIGGSDVTGNGDEKKPLTEDSGIPKSVPKWKNKNAKKQKGRQKNRW